MSLNGKKPSCGHEARDVFCFGGAASMFLEVADKEERTRLAESVVSKVIKA